jgi:putative heme iron utilization protein
MDSETAGLLAKLVRKERIAHLATLRGGAPMVSMTLYLPAGDDAEMRASGGFSAFYVHVSRLAWHTQDMLQDARVALSIAETDDGRPDPFTLMRVSIRGDAVQIRNDDPSFGALKRAWLARFPEQEINFELADFSFWRIAPRDARFVAGFGRIHNLSPAELKNAGA